MRVGFKLVENFTDENGMPAGGVIVGTGITVSFQRGPLGRDEDRVEPNGAFVEDLIDAARLRIEHYQEACDGRFACAENEDALECLGHALSALDQRTSRRESAGIEGTHVEEPS